MQIEQRGGVAAVLLILILSLGHPAGEVIKIVQLGMALVTKFLQTNELSLLLL